ncbi:MAG: putative bifunctional diguanylate cyclase/phosphodiesterase [Pseudomonadota bacterium]
MAIPQKNNSPDSLTLRQSQLDLRGQAEQLRLLYDQLAPAMVLQPVAASIIVWLYWDHGTVSQRALSIWLGLSFAVLLSRFIVVQAFRRLPPVNEQRMMVYRQISVAGALILGSLMGYATVNFNPVLFAMDSGIVYDQAMMVSLIGGLAIVGVASYAPYLPSFFAFILPALVPGGIYLGLSGNPVGEILFFIDMLFTAFLIYAGVRINRVTEEGLALQFRNQSLITYLDRARSDAEALNSKLAREIYERKKAQQAQKDAHDRLESLVEDRTGALQQAYDELARNRERLALAMEASDIGLWDWNLETDEVFHSNFDRMLGYSQEELKTFRGHLQPLVHPDDYPRIRQAMIAHLKGRTERYHMVYRTRHKNGSWRWVEDNGRGVAKDDHGVVLRMIGTRRDVTTQRAGEEQLRLAATVFDSATEGIYIFGRDLRLVKVNAMFTRITGWTEEEVVGHKVMEFTSADHLDLYAKIKKMVDAEGSWSGEVIDRRKNGESYPLWLQIHAVRDNHGKITHYVGIFSDLTQRHETEEKLRYLSNYDRLTGLANRTLFRDRLHAAISDARQRRGNLALLYLDLDRFKQVNDTLGHEFGDKLLYAAATRLMGMDIPADTISRIGGDEFTIIIEDYESTAQLEKLAERIIEEIRAPFYIDDHELLLGVSIGISLFPEHAKELQILINHADAAVNQAKRLGGNVAHIFAGETRSGNVDQLALETSLRKAIFRNEFIVYYQPKFDLGINRITGVEALVRWQHPTRGILAPKDFIPLAEETGLIAAIGEMVLERAARQVNAWRDIGLGNIKVSVNLSAHQVRKGNLVEVVERVIFSSGLPPEQLEMEITESQLMEDLDTTIRMLQQLRKRGVGISLDDFGTGYSSLSYLKRFPIDTVKIDQSFVRDLHKSEDDAAIVRAIIAMSHSLGVRVVAEGVESPAHLEFLRKAGCDAVQGFLIGRPVPEGELIALLRAQSVA